MFLEIKLFFEVMTKMFKAILSRKDLSHEDEYFGFVSDLLRDKSVLSLNEFRHHIGTTRFQHSLNVSYYNYRLCKLFRLNARAAARAGLLHDFFFYNRTEHEKILRSHSEEHALTAFYNASRMFPITELEGDMIVNHMWPMTHRLPRHRETFIITLVDKFCAAAEVAATMFSVTQRKMRFANAFTVMLILNIFSRL